MCVCVCMFLYGLLCYRMLCQVSYVYVCMYVCMYIVAGASCHAKHVPGYECMYACVCVRMCVCMYLCILHQITHIYIYMYICAYIHTDAFHALFAGMHIHIHIHTYIHTDAFHAIFAGMHVHIHIHTYIHTYRCFPCDIHGYLLRLPRQNTVSLRACMYACVCVCMYRICK